MKNKKYKLLKWFPTLPKDWEVGMELGVGGENCYGNYFPYHSKYSDYYVAPNIVENNPEFFEEITEKDVFLITEDGVKVNLKVEIHWVSNYVGGEIKYLYATSLVEPHLFILEDFKVFSSFETAQEWIVLNKPCLSINDVLTSQDGLVFAEKKLIEIVKSKL